MLNRQSIHRIHLIGVAGTGMGAFAGLLSKAGFEVRGSDQNVYSPMKEKLADWKIPVLTPYKASNLEPKPDLVIIGNAISAGNEEAQATLQSGVPYYSFPQALGELFLDSNRSMVVSGTHGKTTSSALLAHTLRFNHIDSGFLIGGIPNNFEESFGCPQNDGAFFVVEGDEYDTAFFDKGPKFLHYRPQLLLCTSLEYDHADIYANVEAIISRFSQLMSLLKPEGCLVMQVNSPHLRTAFDNADFRSKLVTYGEGGDFSLSNDIENSDGISFDVHFKGENLGRVSLGLSGEHNMQNALGCYAILLQAGLTHTQIARGFASFAGVKRRMEVKGHVGELVVIDDFAHHPTAVQTTLHGARQKYGDRPLWALFEPRSASSCRAIFQDDYARSFASADRVMIAPPGRNLDENIALNVKRLASDVNASGIPAVSYDSIDEMVTMVKDQAPKNAVILCMSNGAFGDIHKRILESFAG
jgi:UDP-N-acetylmuramate: L-alanyl-gamma-D-glutamyl-meso-diaminopimelate ligase